MQESAACLQLLPNMLGTLCFSCTDRSVQIELLVLRRSADQSLDIVKDIVNLGRLVNFFVAQLYPEVLGAWEKLKVTLVPHKAKSLWTLQVRDCHIIREAQLLVSEKDGEADQRHSYRYIGGRVPWQPPLTYAPVTREMSLDVVDRLMAGLVYVGLVKLMKDMFVRRQNANLARSLSVTEKEEEVKARIFEISKRLAELQHLFRNRNTFLQQLIGQDPTTREGSRAGAWHGVTETCLVCDVWHDVFPDLACPLCEQV